MKRIIPNYNKDIIYKITKETVCFLIMVDLLLQETEPFFQQQTCVAEQLVNYFNNPANTFAILVALTQSGKTKAMLCFIKHYIDKNTISYENIYIITGLSSIEWKKQTQGRFPKILKENIKHLPDLRNEKLIEELKIKKNIIIIIDETHMAAKDKHSINKFFNITNVYKEKFERDIKILAVSATPNGILYDKIKEDKEGIFVLRPGEGYVSVFNKLNNGTIKQAKCISGKRTTTNNSKEKWKETVYYKNQLELINFINNKWSRDNPKYHIIRLPVGKRFDKTIKQMKQIIQEKNLNWKIIKYCQKEEINIDFISNKPNKHTLIFIKEKLRCAKTLDEKNKKIHIGVLYERIPNIYIFDDVINQGLAGRSTGYNINQDIVVFTNIPSIESYKKLWGQLKENKYNRIKDLSEFWNSATTKYKNINTFATHLTNNDVGGLHYDNKEKKEKLSIMLKTFIDMDAAINFLKTCVFIHPDTQKKYKLWPRVAKRKTIKNDKEQTFYTDSLRNGKINNKSSRIPRSYNEVFESIQTKYITRKKENDIYIYTKSSYYAYYDKPPKYINNKWVGGDPNTLRIIIPLPIIYNVCENSIPKIDTIKTDYKEKVIIGKNTEIKINLEENTINDYIINHINKKYDLDLEYNKNGWDDDK